MNCADKFFGNLCKWPICLIFAANTGFTAFAPVHARTPLEEAAYLDKGLAERLAVFESSRNDLLLRYTSALGKLKNWYQSQGSLQGVVTTDNELKRLNTSLTLSAGHQVNTPAEVARLQSKTLAELGKLQREFDALKMRVLTRKRTVLEAHVKALTRQGKIAEAKAVQDQIDLIGKDAGPVPPETIKSQPASALDSLQTGATTGPDRFLPAGSWNVGAEIKPGMPVEVKLTHPIPAGTQEIAIDFGDKYFRAQMLYNWADGMERYRGKSVPRRFPPRPMRILRYRAGVDVAGATYTSLAELYALDARGRRLNRAQWKVVSVSSEAAYDRDVAQSAFDGDPTTLWHSDYKKGVRPPHELIVDFGAVQTVGGVEILTRQKQVNGTPRHVEVSGGASVTAARNANPVFSGSLFEQNVEAFKVSAAQANGREHPLPFVCFERKKLEGTMKSILRHAVPKAAGSQAFSLKIRYQIGHPDFSHGKIWIGQ